MTLPLALALVLAMTLAHLGKDIGNTAGPRNGTLVWYWPRSWGGIGAGTGNATPTATGTVLALALVLPQALVRSGQVLPATTVASPLSSVQQHDVGPKHTHPEAQSGHQLIEKLPDPDGA